MKTKLLQLSASAVFLFFSVSGYSQVNQDWTSRYNGTYNSVDNGVAVAVDNSGNVIVTGHGYMTGTSRDYITVKYDPLGTQLWVRTFNGEAFGGDYSNALAIDNQDNIYVTGRTDRGLPNYSDITTIKYNSSGVQQWVAYYNGSASGVDEGFAIAVDNLNNVYVAGRSLESGAGLDMVMIKYNNAGVQQWAKTFNGTSNSTDAAASVVVDPSGNPYMCGSAINLISFSDFIVIKYDASGNVLWTKIINGPGYGGDMATKMAIDASGGVYATGLVWASALGYDFYTVKYDASGVLQWEKRYNDPDNLYDLARTLVIDASGNVFVAGESQATGSGYDFALVKYSLDGTEQWVRRYNGTAGGNDYPYSVVTDSRGAVYVGGGSMTPSAGMDYVLLKYKSDGTLVWTQTYNGPGNSTDNLRAIALDGLNYVYVTGESYGPTSNLDIATIKYFQCALLVNAGNDTSIIWGYGSQTATLSASDDGGVTPLSYLWSTGAQTQTINVSPQQTTSYSVSVTDSRGCTALDTVVVNVTNVKCGPGNQKILVCHKGKTICIDSIDVIDHLNHGDQLGACSSSSPITEIPGESKLYVNYPNPFNPATLIKFSLSEPSLVKLTIYDYIGREVAVLINSKYEAGIFSVEWNAANYPSGVYFYRIEAGSYTETRKMILLK